MADKSSTIPKKPKKNLAMHLIAGGVAGCCEAIACHPLDTIKVRLQLRGERQVRTKTSSVIGEAIKAAPDVKPKRQNFVSKFNLLFLAVAFQIKFILRQMLTFRRWCWNRSKGRFAVPIQGFGCRCDGNRT